MSKHSGHTYGQCFRLRPNRSIYVRKIPQYVEILKQRPNQMSRIPGVTSSVGRNVWQKQRSSD